jgi:histidine triad (HIT) family protein
MASLFTKIVNGEIPCYKVAETENCLAFLDINPLSKGHTLVIPKKEIDNICDLDDESYSELFLFSKKIAVAIGKTIPCKKVGFAVVGLEVAHAHIHLVPINGAYDIDFSRPKLKFTKEEYQEISSIISAAL